MDEFKFLERMFARLSDFKRWKETYRKDKKVEGVAACESAELAIKCSIEDFLAVCHCTKTKE